MQEFKVIFETINYAFEIIKKEHKKDIQFKNDHSPVTHLDIQLDTLIRTQLQTQFPKIPVLSEEGAHAVDKMTFWLVDPLDGTKEYISGGSDFTVNIALIEKGRPTLAAIGQPATNTIYFANNQGAFIYPDSQINAKKNNAPILMLSRSHTSEKEKALSKHFAKVMHAGSSIKGCKVATGEAQAYIRLGLVHQWDVAAMDCIVHASGATMTNLNGEKITYLPKDTLINGFLVTSQHHQELLELLQ